MKTKNKEYTNSRYLVIPQYFVGKYRGIKLPNTTKPYSVLFANTFSQNLHQVGTTYSINIYLVLCFVA